VTLTPTREIPPPGRVLRGTVALRGEAVSILRRSARAFMAVVVREAGP
jgi:hypothetical protein